uniref:AAA domain-containing protein n=1 Tax=Candidatus Kentrum sp. FM TaxID=2126340 RepID=A0A450VV07_9GAMM|nr:MAG: AAA domain-containing protein [Candidatus Kentron sp. FM]VFJ50084.1 MAG: AAA domain-containing protein [Candidatus Kentron sp. FM]VFK08651.1 MAG: AAA domain-containing protein [Candidatus Kentron sp. FM]
MAVYAVWNNKGGVGKSYLTFQLSAEYARQNPDRKVLVIDLCPQANASSMLLGGMFEGEKHLNGIQDSPNAKTISGYMDERISSPYMPTNSGAGYITKVSEYNENISENLYLVVGSNTLEIQSSRVYGATYPGPEDAWRIVHLWISDLIADIKNSWFQDETCIFIDCNPSFSIYTELAMTAAERLLIPFSSDGSSYRAVKTVLALVYGIKRHKEDRQSEFFIHSDRYRMALPQIYMYIGNRLTQMNSSSASAFKTIVNEIGQEIWRAWQTQNVPFCIHPNGGSPKPNNKRTFDRMFRHEVRDANSASAVSSALGIPISVLTAGYKTVAGKEVQVNRSQLDKQVPNIKQLVNCIE